MADIERWARAMTSALDGPAGADPWGMGALNSLGVVSVCAADSACLPRCCHRQAPHGIGASASRRRVRRFAKALTGFIQTSADLVMAVAAALGVTPAQMCARLLTA